MCTNKPAFTLAEVLITLTLIGVVAALSIPTLLSSSNATADVTSLKKFYSTLSNAVKLYEANEDSISSLFSGDGTPAAAVTTLNNLSSYLNIIKNCGSGKGCWYDTPLKTLGGTIPIGHDLLDTKWDGDYSKAILADGTMILLNDYAGSCTDDTGDGPLDNTCGVITVDINGAKSPNTIGRDVFYFWITKSGVYPRGAYNDSASCEPDQTDYIKGAGCAAKILAEDAINY